MVRRKAFALVAAMALVSGLAASSAAAQTVDEIVALNARAKGSTWSSIQSMKMTGSAMIQGMEVGMVTYSKRPNLSRQEVTIAMPGMPPMAMTTIFDGQKAWMINPMMGSTEPQEIPDADAAAAASQASFDGPLLNYKAKGHTVELVGPSTVGGKKAHHLKITMADKTVQHLHIDAESGVELKMVIETPAGSVETEMSDYKVVDGVPMPHLMKVMQGGTAMAEMRISKIEFNVPIDDAMFKGK
ncbi:MAG: hypothetical protein AB7L71_01355 [Vicinamibacterales bacterium]